MTQFFRKNYHVIPVKNTGTNYHFKFAKGSAMLTHDEANRKYIILSDTPSEGRAVRRHAPVRIALEYGGRVKLVDTFGRIRRIDKTIFRKTYCPLHPDENKIQSELNRPMTQPAYFDIDY